MKNSFPINELEFRNDTDEEQKRSREIFEVLKTKANAGKFLTEHEKDFFCTGIKLSLLNDGNVEDYPCCQNFIFKSTYLTYFKDLTGGSKYKKAVRAQIVEVPIEEAQRDLEYLYQKAEEWEQVVMKTNHPSQMLQQCSSEARQELRNLNELPEFTNDPFRKGSNYYLFKKIGILLQSKFIYCLALEIFEALPKEDLLFELNSETIEFNEFSLIHILNRHYAEIVKQYDTKKSFHNEDFKPRILSTQLKDILHQIDSSKLLSGKQINKIAFRVNQVDYLIWTSMEIKYPKGKGKVNYRRLNTFYPVTDLLELKVLEDAHNLIKIDDTLSVYVPD